MRIRRIDGKTHFLLVQWIDIAVGNQCNSVIIGWWKFENIICNIVKNPNAHYKLTDYDGIQFTLIDLFWVAFYDIQPIIYIRHMFTTSNILNRISILRFWLRMICWFLI